MTEPNRSPTWDDVSALASAVAALGTTASLTHDAMLELAAPIVRRMASMVAELERDHHGDGRQPTPKNRLDTTTAKSMSEQVREWFTANPGRVVGAADLVEIGFSHDAGSIRSILHRLLKEGFLSKPDIGRYTLKRSLAV